jgi:alpha-methylacyl-CoA racemase
MGFWTDERGTNMLDSGAPYYDCYRCADDRYVAVGALEPQFYAALIEGLELDPASLPDQLDRERWGELRDRFTTVFASRARDQWIERFAHLDACVAPVLTMEEATADAHLASRRTLVEVDGVPQPAPAPRFSGTPTALQRPPPACGQHTDEVLAELGYDVAVITALREAGTVA